MKRDPKRLNLFMRRDSTTKSKRLNLFMRRDPKENIFLRRDPKDPKTYVISLGLEWQL